MKNIIRTSALSIFLLFLLASGLSQDLDLIVTAKGDSIACRIDSIGETYIYFEMKSQNHWTPTHFGLTDVSEYKRNAIDEKQYIYKSGTSIIESPRQEVGSTRDIQKNSVYVGVLSINYGRLIPFDRVGLTISGSLSFLTSLDEGGIGFMVESTLLTGGGVKHFFEPGIMLYYDNDVDWPMPFVRTGYRYQGPEGFLFRVAPLWGYLDGFSFLPALSLGYSF